MPRVPSKQVPKHPPTSQNSSTHPFLSLSLFFLLESMLRPERELQCLSQPEPLHHSLQSLRQKLPLSSLKGHLSALGKGRWEGGNYRGETRRGQRNRHGKRQDIKNPEFWSTLYPTQLDNPKQATDSLGAAVSRSVN